MTDLYIKSSMCLPVAAGVSLEDLNHLKQVLIGGSNREPTIVFLKNLYFTGIEPRLEIRLKEASIFKPYTLLILTEFKRFQPEDMPWGLPLMVKNSILMPPIFL